MPDLELNFELGPLKLLGLEKWLKSDPTAVVAKRFLKAFQDHGVSVPEIQHFFPQITLDKLQKPETLLSVLTNDVLNETAQLFGLQRSWLDGSNDHAYQLYWCYKHPCRLFLDLSEVPRTVASFPFRVISGVKRLNHKSTSCQPLVVLLVQKVREVGGKDIFRYRVYGDGWDWSEPLCRIQLKAMARIYWDHLRSPIPLYSATPSIVEDIRKGLRIPKNQMNGSPLTEPSLEDYALPPEEDVHAQEVDELPYVLKYIEGKNLRSSARDALSGTTSQAS